MLNAKTATQVTFLGEFVSRGRRWNAYSDGTVLPVIAGGDGTAGDPPAPSNPPAPGTPPAGFVSQETVNATVLREAEKAKSEALQQVATDLGVSLEEAKQIIADRRAADDAKRTDAERAAAAWQTAQQGAEEIKRAADQERHDAKVERELQRAGFDITNATLLPAGLAAIATQVQVGADEAAIKAAVEKAKADAPQLFGGTPTPTKHTDPGHQRKDPAAPAGEFGAEGAQEAERRFGKEREKQPA